MDENIIIPEVLKDKNLTKTTVKLNKRDIPKYLNKDVIHEKLEKITNHKDKFFILFLWMTGIRITEAINVTKGDIDFKNKIMVVRWLKNRRFNDRIVPLHSQIAQMLELYSGGMNLNDKIFPFTRINGYYITKKWLGVSPHKLRHSFAVNWLREKGDLGQLRTIMGHKYMNTTGEYLKIVPTDTAKELEKINF